MSLTREQAIAFRDQLREARAVALRDAEGFRDLVLCVERLGAFLRPGKSGLHDCKEVMVELAAKSPLAESVPRIPAPFTLRSRFSMSSCVSDAMKAPMKELRLVTSPRTLSLCLLSWRTRL